MCNLSWTPHSNLEKDSSLNHSCVSPKMGCLDTRISIFFLYTNFCHSCTPLKHFTFFQFLQCRDTCSRKDACPVYEVTTQTGRLWPVTVLELVSRSTYLQSYNFKIYKSLPKTYNIIRITIHHLFKRQLLLHKLCKLVLKMAANGKNICIFLNNISSEACMIMM